MVIAHHRAYTFSIASFLHLIYWIQDSSALCLRTDSSESLA